jgi:inner membrane protein
MSETNLRGQIAGRLSTPAAKIGMISILLVLMLIPLTMVAGLIAERQQRQGEVLADLERGWGPDQTLTGPLLVVPYSWTDAAPRADANTPPARRTGYLRIPAAQVAMQVQLNPEIRRRGLFHAAVYTAQVAVRGAMRIPDLAAAEPGSTLAQSVIDWQHGVLVFGASDLRGLPWNARLAWNGDTVALADVERETGCGLTLFDAPASLSAPKPGMLIPFETSLRLRGVQAFHLQPLARDIDIDMISHWPTPSYTGSSLPVRETTAYGGFSAHWTVSGDAQSANWQQRSSPMPDCNNAADRAFFDPDRTMGVALREAVPTYLMAERAQKYGVLFLALSFLTLFLFEALAKTRIHVVQYGLLGLSVSLFALLLIAVAEPLGFASGYAISTVAVVLQASLYTLAITRRVTLAAVFAGVLGSLFGFLYMVLSLDAYALLAGTVALFAILSVIMAATRRLDWNDAAFLR